MIEMDSIVKSFIDNNWLTISIFLLILKGIARQYSIEILHKFYLILQNAFAIVRPGTSSDSLAKDKEKR